MPFQIIRHDITKVKADAIVNTANPYPIIGEGTDSAIYRAAGEEALLAERKKIGMIERGDAKATPAFNLNAKYIIHTVGPVWDGGENGELDTLKACYENSLNLALQLKCKSIAFPMISTGVYGFPKDKALQIAMSVIQSFLMEHSMKVILVVFDKKAFELSSNIVEDIQEYIDANYVEEARKREYSLYEMEDLIVEYGNAIEEESRMESTIIPRNRPTSVSSISIDDYLASSKKTFQEKLFEIIDARGLTGPQVYKNYISKQVYSKIQADKNYHPNKFTAIALCLSLHLDIDQTNDMLKRAGWGLSESSKADLIVSWCIENKEYNLVKINCILFDFDCPVLEKIK